MLQQFTCYTSSLEYTALLCAPGRLAAVHDGLAGLLEHRRTRALERTRHARLVLALLSRQLLITSHLNETDINDFSYMYASRVMGCAT